MYSYKYHISRHSIYSLQELSLIVGDHLIDRVQAKAAYKLSYRSDWVMPFTYPVLDQLLIDRGMGRLT